jgi:hypothetical protein
MLTVPDVESAGRVKVTVTGVAIGPAGEQVDAAIPAVEQAKYTCPACKASASVSSPPVVLV